MTSGSLTSIDPEPIGLESPTTPEPADVWRFIWAYAWRTYGGALSEEDVEDVQAEIFEWWCEHGLWQALERRASWRSWVAGRIRWRVIDRFRRAARWNRVVSRLRHEPAGDPTPGPEADEEPARPRYLDRLPERHRVVLLLWLDVREGRLRREEAAERATELLYRKRPLSVNAFNIRLTRAKAALRALARDD